MITWTCLRSGIRYFQPDNSWSEKEKYILLSQVSVSMKFETISPNSHISLSSVFKRSLKYASQTSDEILEFSHFELLNFNVVQNDLQSVPFAASEMPRATFLSKLSFLILQHFLKFDSASTYLSRFSSHGKFLIWCNALFFCTFRFSQSWLNQAGWTRCSCLSKDIFPLWMHNIRSFHLVLQMHLFCRC